jgi:hypothetical protein
VGGGMNRPTRSGVSPGRADHESPARRSRVGMYYPVHASNHPEAGGPVARAYLKVGASGAPGEMLVSIGLSMVFVLGGVNALRGRSARDCSSSASIHDAPGPRAAPVSVVKTACPWTRLGIGTRRSAWPPSNWGG